MPRDPMDCDYIPPRMFTFCSRCGYIARVGGKDFMCRDCQRDLFGSRTYDEPAAEREIAVSRAVCKYRLAVARAFRDALPPLWWVGCAAAEREVSRDS